MNGDTINQLAGEIVRAGPDLARLQEILAVSFKKSDENPHWTFYTFELKDGPFAGGEFRLSREWGKALLGLMAREAPVIAESDLDPGRWGQVRHLSASPRIPPEGADAYVYNVAGVQVAFQFTHLSRRLRSVSVEWGAVT
jgi:hypothetical protein